MQREQDFYDRSILIPSDDVANTHLRKTTHTPSMLCHEWVECGHPTEWSQLASTWLGSRLYCMLHVKAYSSNKRHWIIWVVLLYFTWESNKDFTVTEDPSRHPGIRPSTIQPQHTYLFKIIEEKYVFIKNNCLICCFGSFLIGMNEIWNK